MRERFFTPRVLIKNYEEINARLVDQCVVCAKAHRTPRHAERTIWEMFKAERSSLVAYEDPFDGFHAVPASVSKTCLVRFEPSLTMLAAARISGPWHRSFSSIKSCFSFRIDCDPRHDPVALVSHRWRGIRLGSGAGHHRIGPCLCSSSFTAISCPSRMFRASCVCLSLHPGVLDGVHACLDKRLRVVEDRIRTGEPVAPTSSRCSMMAPRKPCSLIELLHKKRRLFFARASMVAPVCLDQEPRSA